jgi:hypothetical protein
MANPLTDVVCKTHTNDPILEAFPANQKHSMLGVRIYWSPGPFPIWRCTRVRGGKEPACGGIP